MKVLLNMLALLLYIGCNSQSNEIVVYKKREVMPHIQLDDNKLKPAADYFYELFGKATGEKASYDQTFDRYDTPVRLRSITKKDKEHYSILIEDGTITIVGTNQQMLMQGISRFFSAYAGLNYISGKGVVGKIREQINVPAKTNYTQEYAFEYREPYFPDNFDVGFRKWYGTKTIEEIWGLWGHNIAKAVKPEPKMMAVVNGKIDEDQFCFSSNELEQALVLYIKRMIEDEPYRNSFMIQPNDNEIVCQCDLCKALGNTKNNASPAVYTLLNKLAAKFPDKHFFSTAYMTTQHAPKFKLQPNAGVMISTMAFPKGIVLEHSNKKDKITAVFEEWKKITGRIYLWDYAVNFDNYFNAYPTLLTAQQNLRYYKKLGVEGVFMHGSEEHYSAYADLKNHIYALLLQNPEIDIRKEVATFFEAKYPDVSAILTDYYLNMEQASFENRLPLDIYGGISQSKIKYLDEEALNSFYDALSKKYKMLSKDKQNDLNPILLSAAFMKLELIRTNGIGINGYKAKPGESIKQEVNELLKCIDALSLQTGIYMYNEAGALVHDYLEQWNTNIINDDYNNLLFGKNIRLQFKPDEGYNKASLLNDGAIGFTDYFNNWMICTQDDLAVEVSAEDVKSAKTITMDFLQDARHNIYPPQKVEVTIGSRKYETLTDASDFKTVSKKRVSIAIQLEDTDKTIHIKTTRIPEHKNRSVACDEIFFKK